MTTSGFSRGSAWVPGRTASRPFGKPSRPRRRARASPRRGRPQHQGGRRNRPSEASSAQVRWPASPASWHRPPEVLWAVRRDQVILGPQEPHGLVAAPAELVDQAAGDLAGGVVVLADQHQPIHQLRGAGPPAGPPPPRRSIPPGGPGRRPRRRGRQRCRRPSPGRSGTWTSGCGRGRAAPGHAPCSRHRPAPAPALTRTRPRRTPRAAAPPAGPHRSPSRSPCTST